MPSLHDLRIGESLTLAGNGQVRVTLLAKSGRLARLEIAADEAVEIQVEAGQAPATGEAREPQPDRAAWERWNRQRFGHKC